VASKCARFWCQLLTRVWWRRSTRVNKIYWLLPAALAAFHTGLSVSQRSKQEIGKQRPGKPVTVVGAASRAEKKVRGFPGRGASPVAVRPLPPIPASGQACDQARILEDRYQKLLFKAAEASGPERLFEVGDDNPELAERLRQRLVSHVMAPPSRVESEVACRGSACRIVFTVSGTESREAVQDRLGRAVRNALTGLQARLTGMPSLRKGTSPEGQTVEFPFFVQVTR
jgi:hypothetical protein